MADPIDVAPGPAPRTMTFGADIVLCIDVTAGMGSTLRSLQQRARQFPEDLHRAMADAGRRLDTLRLKVVAYRDLSFDEVPFSVSGFFTLPEEGEAFDAFLQAISAEGGGDEPESGLEAVAIAIGSDWSSASTKQRHIVAVLTDSSAHPIERHVGKVPPVLAGQIPSTFDALTDLWHGATASKLAPEARRMVLFAPSVAPWTDLEVDWEDVIHFPSSAGDGLTDLDLGDLIGLLAQSI